MPSLLIYTNTAPNSNGNYVYYTTFDGYKAHLATHLLTTIEADKYQINGNFLRLAIDTTITASNYKSISYIINNNDKLCYHVIRCVCQSGYVYLDLSVDYWGSYIALASFDMFNVVRCNRRVGVGTYDAIRATNAITREALPIPTGQAVSGKPLSLANEYAYIVFIVEYAVESTITGSITTTEVFCKKLSEIKTLVGTSTNAVDLACGGIGGIIEAQGTTPLGTLYARVLHAYLLPDGFIFDTPFTATMFKSKSRYGDFTFSVGKCPFVTREKTFSITNDPDYQIYVGTEESGLKLVRTTESTIDVTYRCSPNADKLQITIVQGDNQMDITSNFEVVLTLNGGDVTNLAGVKAVLQYSLKGIANIQTGNIMGITSDVLGMVGNHFNGSTINGGDGAIAMRANGTGYDDCRYPLGLIKCRSINDEQENAKYKGAFFDAYVSSFGSIFYQPLLYGSDLPTYLQANVKVSNIPTEAQRTIKTALASGVYCINV